MAAWSVRDDVLLVDLEAQASLATCSIWTSSDEDEHHRSWVHGHFGAIAEGVARGVCLGDSGFTRRPDRFMSDGHFERLETVRARRDPDARLATYETADGAVTDALRTTPQVRIEP